MSNGAREQKSQFLSEIKSVQEVDRSKSKFNISKNTLHITPQQYHDITESIPVKTYMELRKKFTETDITAIQKIMDSLYIQINEILSSFRSYKKKAEQINTLLISANLCHYIPESKEKLLEYSSNLGLSVNEKSSNDSICYALLGALLNEKSSTFIKQMEKMLYNPDKKGLPDKLSDMTPEQIAGTIIRDIKALSGPISGALLVPKPEFTDILERQPPVFMLLGDYHIGKNECPSCQIHDGCYSLYVKDPTFLKYLANLAKDTNLSIDYFLEDWISTMNRTSNSFVKIIKGKQESALINLSFFLHPCVGQRKENPLRKTCFFTEFRTHLANPRQSDFDISNKYQADTILKWLHYLINYTSMFDDNHWEIFFSSESIVTILKELLNLYSAENNEETVKRFFNSPFFKKYSRTLHEFYKLPKPIQSTLMERLINDARTVQTDKFMMSYIHDVRVQMVEALTKQLRMLQLYDISSIQDYLYFPDLDMSINKFKEANQKAVKEALEGKDISKIQLKNILAGQYLKHFGLSIELLNANGIKNIENYLSFLDNDNIKMNELFKGIAFLSRKEAMEEFKEALNKALETFNLSLGSVLVDIYTISRALKGFDGGLPSQLSVVYQGHAHIINQIELLQDYYDVVKTWGKPDISLGVKQIKCITQNP
jgi:hypothetical protein